ncbi:2-dehydro-3-deoxy-D-gluconate 5-dehydrogenase KduD [Aureimonas sp. AU22]|uniref:2-dehydro-3-deoxy-D-gluconate 5-dehydrogenase KduD n=1 Tax=Aureimonas sp. AU22 TaxID=1638162 RepID=UPI00078246E7|nr:2-dehydro-3-deoxy-D-gluconate 5-dehydrogenase KduD [Aureimonas sp. AU22]
MDLNSFSLAGRRFAVTGANTGIGQGIAVAIARSGGSVIGFGRSDMSETSALVSAAGGTFSPTLVDLSDLRSGVEALEAAMDEAPLDGLVNNAGIIRRADSVDLTEDDWDAVVDLNLKATFFLSQSFGRRCLQAGRPGRIVNIASLLSFQGGIRVPSYTASKHGVAGITKILANEWAARGVNVNAIAPGYIETNNTAALRADPDRTRAILERIPAGRWGAAEDIGAAAAFLLADASRYIHGVILPVDGGWLAR